MPYVKTSDEILTFTKFLPKNSSRKLRIFHYQNKLDYIPKCEFTGVDSYFSHTGYVGVSKFIFVNLVIHDNDKQLISSFR